MLVKKLLRELWQNKAQFINIFIMIFLATFIFAGVHAYMDGMRASGDDFYEQNNLADLWISGALTAEDLETVKSVDNVKSAETSLTLILNLDELSAKSTETTPENSENSTETAENSAESVKTFQETTLSTTILSENNINSLYIKDGAEFTSDSDGLYLEYLFAKKNNLEVGDQLTLSYAGETFTAEILALVEAPDKLYTIKDANSVFPTHDDYGFAYLSETSLENLLGFSLETYDQIVIDLSDEAKLSETKQLLEETLSGNLAITDRENLTSYEAYNSEIEEGETYSTVFTALFVFIALLSVITSTNRFVKKQRSQIGTLKALGFSRRKIIFHYLGYNFLLSTFAALLGFVLGALSIGNYFLNMEMEFFEVPEYSIVILPEILLIIPALVLLITFTTYLSCRKILNEPAAEAIRVETPKIKTRGLNFSFKHLGPMAKWNLRDISRNKGRTITTIVGIVGCSSLLILALGLFNSLDYYISWKFETLNNFEYKLSLNSDISDSELAALTETYGDATSETLGVEIKQNDGEKYVSSITISDAKDKLRFSRPDLSTLSLEDDGIYLTKKLAETLNLSVGDELTFHEFGSETWYTTTIIGLNRDPQDQTLTMTRAAAENLGLTYSPTALYTDADLSETKTLAGVEDISSIASLKSGVSSMLERMTSLIYLFIILAATLAFVIIYNLGTLGFFEKNYQFATLKVLGFSSKNIRKIFETQGFWISLIAILISLPCGYFFADYTFHSALGDNYDFPTIIYFETCLISVVGTLLVSFLTYRLLSRKIKSIDMVMSLKANE